MRNFLNMAVACLLAFVYCQGAGAQIENHDVRVGNKVYRAKNFDAAEKKYRAALSKKETSFYGNYNLGNTLYRKNDQKTARNYYQKAVACAGNKKQRADVYHNIGRSFLAEKNYKDAVVALKKSMINNPNANDTRKLLAYAMRMEKRENQKNPPQPNAGNKKMEDDSDVDNRKILEMLDQDEQERQPKGGTDDNVKNW